MAEETGLLLPIGRLVLRRACQQVRAWQRTIPGYGQLNLSVNLSSVQLEHPDLVAEVAEVAEVTEVAAALADAELDPRHLTLELTESLLIDDTPATATKLEQLKLPWNP